MPHRRPVAELPLQPKPPSGVPLQNRQHRKPWKPAGPAKLQPFKPAQAAKVVMRKRTSHSS